MTRGNGSLERVGSGGATKRFGTLERRQTAPDQQMIPAPAVLVQQQNRLTGRSHAGTNARRLDLHQRNEPVDLRFGGSQLGEDPPQAERVLTERRPDPLVARRRGVALVEDEIYDLEHRLEALG